MSRNRNTLVGALAVVCTGSFLAHAQTVTGGVTGTVTDPSGAVLPGAKVTAHNLDTGVDSLATTDAAGLYRIQFLPIGRYTVSITAAGFGAAQVPAFQLEALQRPTFNIKLKLGESSTTVDVSDAAPILDTSDPTLSGTFTANTIQNFPLNGLDFSALTLYVPGAVSSVGTSGTTSIGRSLSWTDSVNVDGNRAQANNYTLDGIDLNETFNNVIAYSPAPESLGEVKVLTANSPADYGNVNGGGVVAVLKSGTNHLHGSLYGYLQDYRLNANSWQNKHVAPPSLPTPTNSFSQAQFGGTLGGPIVKDKLFFFVDYLGSRYHNGGTASGSVLTQAMRNGDFSALLNPALGSNTVQLYNSQAGFAPFFGDVGVPVLNPVAKFLFANPSLYPLPNTASSDGLISNNYRGPQRTFRANNQGDSKIEYDPRPADKITAFYSMGTYYNGNTSLLPTDFPGGSIYPSKVGGATWVHIFSPTVVNAARVGYTRVQWEQGLPVDQTGQFGTSGDAKLGITFPNQAYQGFTVQNIGNGASSIGNSAQNNGSLVDNTFSYIDNLTIQFRRHTVSMGVQALRYQNNYPTSNNSGYLGNLNYSGVFTGNTDAGSNGYGPADFLLDYVSGASATLGSVNVGQRQWRAAGFISDEYKAAPNLTLTFGIRYEYDQPWIESNNKTGNIDLTTGRFIYADHVPDGAPAGSGVCPTRACYQPNYTQIMPRLGFAYQATPKFVVRGGYGATSFYEGNSSNQRLTSITPFIQGLNINIAPPTPAGVTTPRTAEQGFTGVPAVGTGSLNAYPQNIQPAYVQEFSLTTEYALNRTLSLQVGYLGETGQHIEDFGNANQPRINGDPTSSPYYNNQLLGIADGQFEITESRAMMNYNALQAVLRQRTNYGLEFTVNYAYGKAMTNSAGNYPVNTSGANGYLQGAFQNYYDSSADYGPAAYDVTHNLSGTAVYALPVGQGKQFLSGVNRVVDEAIGGWRLSLATVAYSGFPETITGPNNNGANNGGFANSRPNQYRPLKIVNRSPDHWYGTDPSATPCTQAGVDNGVCAFGVPANNVFGDARNGNTRGPRYFNMDTSAFKDFHTFREQTVGFRFDAFNVFNVVSYGNPDTGILDTMFGNITNQGTANGISQAVRSTERRLQFSANYRF